MTWKEWRRNMNKLSKNNMRLILCVCIGVTLLAYSITSLLFRYEDTVTNTIWSVNFWDVLFGDGLSDYYRYGAENIRGAIHGTPDKNWITLLLEIVWVFPLWLYSTISGNMDVTGMVSILYMKTFLVLCVAIICVYVYRIVNSFKDIDEDSALLAVLLTVGSMEIYDSVAYAGQDEIVYLMLFVMGVYYRFANKWYLSIPINALAVAMCPIMFLPIFCIEVLFEKRIIRLVGSCILLLLPILLFEFAYRNDEVYSSIKGMHTISSFQLMMSTGVFQSTIGNVSIAFIGICIIFFFSYVSNEKEDELKKQAILYSSLMLIFLCFLSFMKWHRCCLYVPLFAVLISFSKENRDMKALLFIEMGILRFVAALANPYNFNLQELSPISTSIFGPAHEGGVINPLGLVYDSIFYIIRPIIMASMIILLYLCLKKNDKSYKSPMSWKTSVIIQSSGSFLFVLFVIAKLCIN